ncbi:hypothetical protein ACT1UH_02160 [Mycoplasma sp. 332]|uniref:hypothetical protein n=1 Tax=Mycoplasma sp. 332 TaxID=3458236 RepID=UPI004036C0F6
MLVSVSLLSIILIPCSFRKGAIFFITVDFLLAPIPENVILNVVLLEVAKYRYNEIEKWIMFMIKASKFGKATPEKNAKHIMLFKHHTIYESLKSNAIIVEATADIGLNVANSIADTNLYLKFEPNSK